MKWSDLTYDDFYVPYDENQRAIRGFLLTTLGIDLENLPMIFHEPFNYYESQRSYGEKFEDRKVFLSDIVGTSYSDYGGMGIIFSYMKIKRAHVYIQDERVARNKYFYMLKKPFNKQNIPIILSQNVDGNYFVDGNGNHRIILYKIMMLSEIATTYPYACSDDYDLSCKGFEDIRKKYWLNAKVRLARA